MAEPRKTKLSSMGGVDRNPKEGFRMSGTMGTHETSWSLAERGHFTMEMVKEGDQWKFYSPSSGRWKRAQHVFYHLGGWVLATSQDLIRAAVYWKGVDYASREQHTMHSPHQKGTQKSYQSAYMKSINMQNG